MSMLANLGQALVLARSLVLDGWENSTTGLGTTALDKTTGGRFVRQQRFSAQYLADLFDGDALAARMCEHEPKEMLRKGFEVTPGDEGDAQAATDVLTALTELGAGVALQQGLVWEDVFGGSVVLLGIDDGETDPQAPLNEANIRSITGLHPLEGSRCWAHSWYPATHPKAGQVEVWGIMPIGGMPTIGSGPITQASARYGTAKVHESRLLVFPGGICTTDQRLSNNGWGRSILAAVHDPLMDYNMSWRGVTHMLQSANQDVWFISGLKNALADTTGTMVEYLKGRFQLSQMKMGPNRGIVMDADGERLERLGSQFTGVPDTIEQQALRLAAARGWPVTILLGRSPAGMNATGESDMDTWYNLVAADRAQRLDPRLKRLITLVMLSKEGPTKGKVLEGWGLRWPAFKQLTELEQATLRNTQAQTDQVYLTNQVIRPEEIAVSRFRPEGWSGETVIDLDARNAALESDKDTAPASDPGTKGAQTDALIKIQEQVAKGFLPRENGVRMLMNIFGMTIEAAEEQMGAVGTPAFEPKAAEPSGPIPPQLQPFAGKPGEKPDEGKGKPGDDEADPDDEG